MPGTERVRPAETREMRLISQIIESSRKVSDVSLAQFIARRRHPEAGPNSWNEISHALTPVIFGEFVTEGTIRKWAAVYGIPDPNVGDRVMAALILAENQGDKAFDPQDFRIFLAEQPDLGPKQWPSYVRVAGSLPRTETFKVIKRRL